MPGPVGELIGTLRHLSMSPPYPWGQWLYGRVLREHWAALEGDLIELGVGLGGMSLFLGALAAQLGKRVWSLDSFVGLPEPSRARDNPFFKKGDYGPRPDETDLLGRFKREIRRRRLSAAVLPLKGFFAQSLKKLPPGQSFCLAHLDSDVYESVYTSLAEIYERVVPGGVIIIDDYFHHAQGPLRAASDFFNHLRVRPVYHVSFPYSVFLFKGEEAGPSLKRSLDGNTYSFEWLRKDRYFRKVLGLSIERCSYEKEEERSFQNRLALRELLRAEGQRSSDIYSYWRALESYWDMFAHTTDEGRPPQLI